MRFESITKVLAKCMLQYHMISTCGATVLLISTETAAWKCRRLRQVQHVGQCQVQLALELLSSTTALARKGMQIVCAKLVGVSLLFQGSAV